MQSPGSDLSSRDPRAPFHQEKSPWPKRIAGIAALACGFLTLVTCAAAQNASGNAAYVNPFIGTGTVHGANANSSKENTFPGPSMPFGMVQLSPNTESHGYGYHYAEKMIHGFSMTHMSGVGCPNEGDVFFTPTTGPIETRVVEFESSYSHKEESASPGYYDVRLLRWGINVALTATNRTGEAKIVFPAGKTANLLVPISRTLNQTIGAHVRVVGSSEVEGYVRDVTFCGRGRPYKVYFVMHFSRRFTTYGTWSGYTYGAPAKIAAGGREATESGLDRQIGAYVSWPSSARLRTVLVKVGISYVDLEGAQNNLKVEAAGRSFAQIHAQAETAWNKALGVIDVRGGTRRQRTVFYTALYHSMLMPSLFSDVDGRYLGFDGKIHRVTPGHAIYANFSGWDIYRSEMPLLALIAPKRMADMAQSIVLMYQQGGWIGRWPQINQYTNVMAGSPLSTVVATAWLDGIHDFNIKAAWQGMYKDATGAPPPGSAYQGELGIKWINKLHYVPNDKVRYGSVSQLQEDCVAYASLYDLAKALGKNGAARTLYERALYYRNLFDPADRMFRPKNADGKWVTSFSPDQSEGFIEGSGWQYQWFAPADLAWVIHAVGRDRFNRRLTQFFSYGKPEWVPQYYNAYNEPDLEAPFEFNFSGEPWKAQYAVRRVLSDSYTETPDGIAGNDDAGEMSSWATMSMMGFYSVDPASRAYELVSPVFSRVVIHLHAPYTGKTFTIETSPDPTNNPYIQSVRLDGRVRAKNWVSFPDISKGGTLSFALGSSPNRHWGAAAADAPPSLSDYRP